MLRWTLLASAIISAHCYAGSTLTSPRFSSCFEQNCVEIKSKKAFQGSVGSASLYFANPTLRIIDPKGKEQLWQAGSIYFDAIQNRLFIRELTSATEHKPREAYYQLNDGKLFFIAGR